MMKSHFTFLVAVHAFFMRDNKVLLLKRANTGYMDGFYSVPAGHVDGGETIANAMIREIQEEVGVQFSILPEPSHVMHRLISDDEERIDYFFEIKNWEGEPQNKEPQKCSELVWVDCNNLPENTIPYIKFAMTQLLQRKMFSEFSDSPLK